MAALVGTWGNNSPVCALATQGQRSGIEHPEDSTEAVYLGPAIMDVGLGGGGL